MTDSVKTETASVSISDEWFLVYDEATARDYYFNIDTQESHWERPPGLENCTIRRYEDIQSESEAVSEHASQPASDEESQSSSGEETELDGWHYMYNDVHTVFACAFTHEHNNDDMSGQMQGPFQKEQLMIWRGHFPMNTLLWKTHQVKSINDEDTSLKAATFLAAILNDHHLLLQWQSQTPNHAMEIAPSAVSYEHYLKHPIIPEEQIMDVNIQSQARSYEDAVLAGLPPDDETTQLVDLARQSGTPLTEIRKVVEAASSDGTSTQLIVTDPYTGKMTAVPSELDEGHALYAEFGSWIDPTKLGDGLNKSAKYRREKLPSLWMKQVGYKKRVLPWQDERYDRGDYD